MALLRCLTFNIWKNEGRYDRRIAAIAAILQAQQADVVALQECFVAASLGLDSAATLAAAAGYRVTRYPMRSKRRWHSDAMVASRSDMAILTRALPEGHGRLALPQDPRDGERGVLWVDLRIAGRLVRLGCTHLTHLHDSMAQVVRHQQAATAMAALMNQPGWPAILMGDLNAPCGDPTVAPIFDHPDIAPEALKWAGGHDAGPSPANGAIDHVLLFGSAAGPGETGHRMISRSIIAAPDTQDPDGSPSDHPAILAEVEFS